MNIKNVSSATANVKISNIENVIPAIFIGQFINVSNIIDNIVIATGSAKYNNKKLFMSFSFLHQFIDGNKIIPFRTQFVDND